MDGLTVQRTESAYDAAFATETWQRNGTRLLVATPARPGTILDHLGDVHRLVGHCLYDQGAVLFRGFDKGQVAEFHDLAASFGPDLLPYEFASTPRTRIQEGVYSSTEYPAHQWIPQHNEQAYTLRWPMKIWFYCDIAAPEGGETPVTNSREVYRRIDPTIRARFAQKKLMYVRNYGNGLDVPWEQVFRTSEPADVEAFCRAQQITWEWLDDGGLRTRQICQSEARHPVTGEMVWFNQAHLFHISSLEPDVRESLLAVVDEADLPRNVYYGDGTPIEDGILDDIRGLYRELTIRFQWQEGDILLLDNMLTAHGRAPFKGSRRVLVAMAEPWPIGESR
jgi:alpha-ketoglutarate-dependent taurine dioxygenase